MWRCVLLLFLVACSKESATTDPPKRTTPASSVSSSAASSKSASSLTSASFPALGETRRHTVSEIPPYPQQEYTLAFPEDAKVQIEKLQSKMKWSATLSGWDILIQVAERDTTLTLEKRLDYQRQTSSSFEIVHAAGDTNYTLITKAMDVGPQPFSVFHVRNDWKVGCYSRAKTRALALRAAAVCQTLALDR